MRCNRVEIYDGVDAQMVSQRFYQGLDLKNPGVVVCGGRLCEPCK